MVFFLSFFFLLFSGKKNSPLILEKMREEKERNL